ncbi:MAG: SDR family oxidoreductase [Nannocystaceae bacterium]|nr:SDR family oxidoreductase [bacterium]
MTVTPDGVVALCRAMAKPHMCPPALLEKDLSGQTFVVTGANSGIGFITARQLASQGATVVMGCRRPEDGEARAQEIRDGHTGATLEVVALDLGDLASVRACAESVLKSHDALTGLINNAGVMNTPEGKTSDGFETQIGVNHLGHVLLTELLLPALKKGHPARVVNVSSCFHDQAMGRDGVIDLDDLFFETRDYDGWAAYAQSKLANLLHAKALAKSLEGTGVTAVSVHPGWVRTNLARHSMPLWVQNYIMRPILGLMGMVEPWVGAQTSLYAALADDVPEHAGAYYSQLGVYRDKSCNRGGWPMKSPNPAAHDEATADALYDKSRALVGLA